MGASLVNKRAERADRYMREFSKSGSAAFDFFSEGRER
jgi:hypothetical protein